MGGSGHLADVRLGDRFLSGNAFASEAAFLFPDESRALVHALLRVEFARMESERLQLSVSASELDSALEESRRNILSSLAPEETLDDWAFRRFGRSWQEAQVTLQRHLSDNQLYQLCTRSHALERGRVELQMLITLDREKAQTWVRKLKTGASASAMAVESLDPGPNGDGRLPPLPRELPGDLGNWMAEQPEPGSVFGPFQFANERVWRVVLLERFLPPEKDLPPKAVLLEQLRLQPISPLEEEAWFEAMANRYNAVENLPAIQAPAAAFVRLSN